MKDKGREGKNSRKFPAAVSYKGKAESCQQQTRHLPGSRGTEHQQNVRITTGQVLHLSQIQLLDKETAKQACVSPAPGSKQLGSRGIRGMPPSAAVRYESPSIFPSHQKANAVLQLEKHLESH